jgi:hypothetical protein
MLYNTTTFCSDDPGTRFDYQSTYHLHPFQSSITISYSANLNPVPGEKR